MTYPNNLSANYDVDAYKIIYTTKGVNGELISVSGLLSIPRKASTSSSPLLSLQHGTAFLDEQVPSLNDGATEIRTIAASMGYIVAAADYIGYVESSHLMHPYTHAETLASTTIDMLKASQSFLEQEGISSNGQLFLMGYSEGGYATLAAQKALQEKPCDGLTVTASAPGAGPYDVFSTAKMVASVDEMHYPSYIAFIVKAYDAIYALNKLAEVIQPQYFEIINSVFDGSHSGDEINEMIPNKPAELFSDTFLMSLKEGTEQSFSSKMKENSIYDWVPQIPTHFYHGRDDLIVPYTNAVTVMNKMREKGAKELALTDCELGEQLADHVNCGLPFFVFAFDFFEGYVADLSSSHL